MRRILFGVLAVVTLAVLAAVVFAATYDANALKPRIVEAVRKATGRTLAINGDIGVTLFPPGLRMRDLTLSNVAGGSRPDMARLASVTAEIALAPLMHRHVQIDRLVLDGPDVLLEQRNWVFTPERQPDAPPQTVAVQTRSARWTVGLGTVRVEDGVLAAAGGPAVRISSLTARMQGQGAVHLDADAALGAMPFTLTGDAGPTPAEGALPIDLTAKAGGATVAVKGTTDDMAISAAVPDLAALGADAGQHWPPLTDMTLRAHATRADAGRIMLSDLAVMSAQGDAAGTLTVGPRFIAGTFASQRVDLDAILARPAPSSPSPAPPEPATASAPQTPAPVRDRRVIPDTRLPLEALHQGDADVHLSVATMHTGGVDYRNVAAHAVLHAGVLSIDPVGADLPAGHLDARLHADTTSSPPRVALYGHAPQLALKPMLTLLHLPDDASGDIDVDLDATGEGETVRAVAATVDGHLGLSMVGGHLGRALIGGTLGAVLREANLGAAAANEAQVRCFALRADAVHGVATLRALSLDTPQVAVDGAGTVNLADETLSLRLKPLVRLTGTGVIVPLDVTGTLASPRAKVNAAAGAADAIGQFAGGAKGLVIGALDKSQAGSDSCSTALAIARGGAAGPAPAEAPAPPAKTVKPADLLRQFLR